ncbi:Flp family type IVb pilin [Sinorhizobium prairiense]|uniref:Flp family type IVb pilin n=1 Tax=unclassified Sinorhizobium TaxID=2613772 RepID=UPI0023D7EEED|nr:MULTISPECIES: Flp family type IVb pilin [unclassified Sinorhizobium]WEJ10229.1 Flp family type IVb pilin [Sinorhizobium sp. M103]WEJ15209.1 Flp family type IVb pilin [Sinorhizobium sp. K101]WEJ37196.1 Flp family type IVb pilin [Sinorhizobium sp. C101]
MKTIFARLMKDESGATAIEYGLIAALISVALISGASALGGKLNTQFENISKELKYTGSATPPATPPATGG